MGKIVRRKIYLALDGRRISKDANVFQMDPSRAEIPDDNLEDNFDAILPGAFNAELSISGGTSEELELLFLQKLADAENQVLTMTACLEPGGLANTIAAFCKCRLSTFKWTGEFNQRRDFMMDLYPDDRVAWGKVLFQGVGTAGITGATNGSVINLGAIPAGSELVLSMHVLDPPGVLGTLPTLDGKLRSAAAVGFASPTDRITFTQETEPNGAFYQLDGPVTDAYWRVEFSAPGGTTPNFTVLIAAAIRVK